MVPEAINIIQGNRDIKLFGELLNQTWETKRSLSNKLSNDEIDRIYTLALSAGAIGGKLLGAGNGGFMLFYARKKNHKKILNSLKNYLHVPFNFDTTGSQIIYYSKS